MADTTSDIVAAIQLVRSGIATRVMLVGFPVPPGLAEAADAHARGLGCRAIARIGAQGALGLDIVVDEPGGG